MDICGAPVKNKELWVAIDALCRNSKTLNGVGQSAQWSSQNEAVDKLARDEATRLKTPVRK